MSAVSPYKKDAYAYVMKRLAEPRGYIQVLAGPRQVGKTTLALQVCESLGLPSHYATADEPLLKSAAWLEQQWESARLKSRGGAEDGGAVLVLDEIQKITGWSETVKRMWDEDTREGRPLRVLLLGSSPLLMQKGMTESLAGRFEIIPITHWTYREMQDAFGWELDQFIFFGGYPGAASLIHDEARWRRYILDSLIETTIGRDILLLSRVDKPALLRRLFELGCQYSGQVLSYQKMLGQLQDAGNTTTLAHYLELLQGAGLLMGLQKFAGQTVRRRASSPKLLSLNTALMSAVSGRSFQEAKSNPGVWGRYVESSVGAYLANAAAAEKLGMYYWSSANREVDFVLQRGEKLVAIEVKSGYKGAARPGMDAFSKGFPVARKLAVGMDGIPIGEFLQTPLSLLLD